MIKEWFKKLRGKPKRMLALGAIAALPSMPFVAQCAPAPKPTCAVKPSAVECTPPYLQVSSNGTAANAYAGTQYLQEAGQPLLRVIGVRSGDNFWTRGEWSNADNINPGLLSAYLSTYPRKAQFSYETSHS